MTETRRTFLKKLGMLGALALVSPTGVIEAIVPKEPESPLSQGELGIIERFTLYCHSRPPRDVGHSVCGVEIMQSDVPFAFGKVIRGLSMGADKKTMKYWNCMLHPQKVYSDEFIDEWAKDACVQLRLAWTHGKQAGTWGVAPRTMTQKEAHKLVYRAL